MYETIKKFLSEGGKCLLIENGKPIGVILTMEEYELLKSKLQITNPIEASAPTLQQSTSEVGAPTENVGADLADINLTNDISDVTLEDLGLDPDIQLPKDF